MTDSCYISIPTAAYDEDIGGFQFSRATNTTTKKLKSGLEGPIPNDVALEKTVLNSPRRGRPPKNHITQPTGDTALEDTRPSTRNGKAPRGRPKRVSLELQGEIGQNRKRGEESPFPAEKPAKKGRPTKAKSPVDINLRSPEPSQGATSKIALPLADTPVIRRNKEMREGRAGKKQRRSSLGMRGRRASSLIDSGASNGTDTFPMRKEISIFETKLVG
jgi:kinetochore protein Mis13/DSN1